MRGVTSRFGPDGGQRDAAGAARRYLEALANGDATRALRDELAAAVLDAEDVRLALAVREGGPHATRRAIELAERVLGAARGDGAKTLGGGRRRKKESNR